MESNATKSQLDDKLNVVETQNNLEVDAKVKTDLTAKRVTVAKNVVAVFVKKSVADGTAAKEPDPDTNSVVPGNIQNEFKWNVAEEELANPASSSQKTLKLGSIPQLEKLIYVSKVGNSLANTIVGDKHVFDKEHNCVMVLVIITGTKLLVYYLVFVCQLMNDVTMASLDIYNLLLMIWGMAFYVACSL